MIIQLRRRHFYTWLGIGFLLPIGFIWAYLNVPEMPSDAFHKTVVDAYPNIIKSKETGSLKANLRQNTEGSLQIEFKVLKPLVGAANQLYLSTEADKPLEILLGALNGTGTYYFSMPKTVTSTSILNLTIYDAIKQKQIEQIILKP